MEDQYTEKKTFGEQKVRYKVHSLRCCNKIPSLPQAPPPNLTFKEIKINNQASGHVYMAKESDFYASENVIHTQKSGFGG